MTARRAMVVVGTRPEAIKLASVIRALEAHPHLDPCVVATAQHREMLDQALETFGIVPDVDLSLQRPQQALAGLAARSLEALDRTVGELRPAVVFVQGDTTSTFTGALAAFYHQVPVVHVEAGLRTGDRYSPFPEELNRRLTTQLASLHLAPTQRNAANLRREGVPAEAVVVTGNTVIDALIWASEQPTDDPTVAEVLADGRPLVLVTAHRRESWGAGMAGIGTAVAQLASRGDVQVVLPAHRNPAVRAALLPPLHGVDGVKIVDPLGYVPFAHLLRIATLVLTDSGGIQEEAPAFGTPVLVLRDDTERPEAVQAGCAILVGTDPETIQRATNRLLDDDDARAAMAEASHPFGRGDAGVRSVAAAARLLGQATGDAEG